MTAIRNAKYWKGTNSNYSQSSHKDINNKKKKCPEGWTHTATTVRGYKVCCKNTKNQKFLMEFPIFESTNGQ